MKKAVSVLVMLLVATAASAQTTNAPGKVIGIVNAAGVSPEMLQAIEAGAERSLNVPFETVTIPPVSVTNLLAAHPTAKTRMLPNYAAMVMLVNATTAVVSHASYDTNTAISIVNVTAMRDEKTDLFQQRLVKQVVRGTVFAFGIPPSKDPLCVSRDYMTLHDFDTIIFGLFPPWQWRFDKIAVAKDLPFLTDEHQPRTRSTSRHSRP
jgi:hypothetical protein